MALNFLKLDPKVTMKHIEGFRHTHPETIGKDPFRVVLIHRGMGLGYDTVIVSFHKDYSSYDDFRYFAKHAMGESVAEMNTFLINLDEEKTLSLLLSCFFPAK